MDDAKCFAVVRQHRWSEGVQCPGCGNPAVVLAKPEVCAGTGATTCRRLGQRYRCKACAPRYDDLTGTLLAGHHQLLRVWVLSK